MKINFLTKDNKKELLRRVAHVLREMLLDVKASQKLTFKEMSAVTGIPQNRLSEIIQKQLLSEKTLTGIIGGSLVKVSDLLKKTGPLSVQEKSYLENFYLFENRELKELLLKYVELKKDPVRANTQSYALNSLMHYVLKEPQKRLHNNDTGKDFFVNKQKKSCLK